MVGIELYHAQLFNNSKDGVYFDKDKPEILSEARVFKQYIKK